MSVFDVVLLGAFALAIVGGYRLGFIARVISWIGLAAGLALAVWLLPKFLEQLGSANHGLLLVLSVGLLLVGATLGQAVGFFIGGRLTPSRRDATFGVIDRILGALAGLLGVVIILWLVVPVFVATPGWLATQTSNSWIARTVDNSLPPPPDAMQALRTVIGDGSFPDVFDALRPSPNLGAPPASTGISIEVAALVARSVVKVEGPACDKLQDGSGFVVGEGLIATNAHVVAGERSTTVIRNDAADSMEQSWPSTQTVIWPWFASTVSIDLLLHCLQLLPPTGPLGESSGIPVASRFESLRSASPG